MKLDDCVVVFRLVSFFSASKKAETSSTNCISLFFFAGVSNFPPSFSWFFFYLDGIFLARHLRHLFVTRFIKSTFATMFTITGITSTVLTFIVIFKELLLKGLPKNRNGQWWQKGICSCPLKVIFDASLGILYTAFLQKLYCARVSHEMAEFVLEMSDFSILMEPTLLLKKGSATVSYNAFGWCCLYSSCVGYS